VLWDDEWDHGTESDASTESYEEEGIFMDGAHDVATDDSDDLDVGMEESEMTVSEAESDSATPNDIECDSGGDQPFLAAFQVDFVDEGSHEFTDVDSESSGSLPTSLSPRFPPSQSGSESDEYEECDDNESLDDEPGIDTPVSSPESSSDIGWSCNIDEDESSDEHDEL